MYKRQAATQPGRPAAQAAALPSTPRPVVQAVRALPRHTSSGGAAAGTAGVGGASPVDVSQLRHELVTRDAELAASLCRERQLQRQLKALQADLALRRRARCAD